MYAAKSISREIYRSPSVAIIAAGEKNDRQYDQLWLLLFYPWERKRKPLQGAATFFQPGDFVQREQRMEIISHLTFKTLKRCKDLSTAAEISHLQ